MAFKIKDGVRIGAVDVFNNSADLLAPNVLGTATVQAAATQDAIKLAGRAGGTNSRAVTLTPTTLTGNVTLTLPDRTDTVATLLDTYAYKTITVTDTDSLYTWAGTGSSVANATGDTLVVVSGAGINVDVDATNEAIKISHADTSSQASVSNTGSNFIQSITLDEFGHITAITSADSSVAETDTLQTVTTRGNTTTTSVSITNNTTSTSTATGALTVTGGVGIGGNLYVGGNTVITGNLTVEGTTVTLNTATLDVEDLNITVAKGAADGAAANGAGLTVDGASATLLYANADDSWNFNKLLNLTSLSVADDTTLGADDTDTITVNAVFVNGTQLKTNTTTSDTLAISAYDVDGAAYVNLITLTASNAPFLTLSSTGTGSIDNMTVGATTAASGAFTTLTASGNVTGSGANAVITFSPTGTGTVTISPATAGTINNMSIGATTAAAGTFTALTVNDNTTLGSDGTDTITVNAVFVSGTKLKTNTTATNTLAVSAYDVDGAAYVDLITLTASNTPTLALTSTGTGSINNMNIGSTTAGTGAFTTLTASDSVTLSPATNTVTINPTNVGSINNMNIGATTPGTGAFTNLSATGSFSITDTTNATSNATGAFQVDGGVSVDKDIYLSGNLVYATAAGTKVGEERGLQTTVSSTSASAIDTWAIATYRYARYIVQITQGTDIQISEIRMTHDGTTTYMTEYAVLETNGPIAAAFTSDISTGNARLLVTMTSATAATINIVRTLVVV